MKTLLAICLLFGATVSYAQESSDTFQIKDYKYRTPGFRALSFDFNFSGSFSRQGWVDSFKHTQNNIHISPAKFNFYKNSSSDSRFHESNYTFSIGGSFSKMNTPSEYRKYKQGSGSFDWYTTNQYFRKNDWFWELGNEIKLTGDITKQNTNSYYQDETYLAIKDHPILGMGNGRIEIVNDAQMALFILNDLEKQGLIINKGSREQQNAFAQVITDINNQRVFDTRQKRIYELQRIDSFIRSSGLNTATDIRHFTTINDNLVYAFSPLRHHGNQWRFRIRPGAAYERYNYKYGNGTWEQKYKPEYITLIIAPELSYESRNAKSLQWQRNFSLGLSYRYTYSKNISDKIEYSIQYAEVSGSYLLGYFPNTRTYISAEVGGNIQRGNFLYNGENGIRYTTGINLQTSYFLGYRTRLMAGFGVSYNSRDIQTFPFTKTYQEYGFNSNVYCSISHNIF